MTRDEATAIAKTKLSDYLEHNGIPISKKFHCLNPDHTDRHPSMSFDRKRNKVRCFSCKEEYDIFDLVGIETGFEGKKLFDHVFSLYGLEVDEHTPTTKHLKNPQQPTSKPQRNERAAAIAPAGQEQDYTAYYFACRKRLSDGESDYLKQRGISPETAAKHNLGFDPTWRSPNAPASVPATPRLIIPLTANSYFARATDKEDTYAKMNVGPAALFNLEALKSTGPVFVTEGAIDAMSIEEAGGTAIGLNSTANDDKFLEALAAISITELPPIIIALDNDHAGYTTANKIEEKLNNRDILFYRPDNLFVGYKDANEALCRNRDGFCFEVRAAISAIEEKKEAYRRENSISAYITEFKERLKNPAEPISTGFDALDASLDGGIYPGLTILGAISSLGKTAFALQIADKMATAGHDCLFFSLEMSKDELMARSLSRFTLNHAQNIHGHATAAKTMRGILRPDSYHTAGEDEILAEAWKSYEKLANHFFIVEAEEKFGASSIKTAIEKHIANTRKNPVVFIDYLQILAPEDPRATDKQAMDKSVLELRRICRAFKLPIFAISSFNRESYKTKANMTSFKESGALEYGADVLLGLQLKGAGEDKFDVDEAKSRDPRKIELIILKNRNGRTGTKIDIDFYPKFNFFS